MSNSSNAVLNKTQENKYSHKTNTPFVECLTDQRTK